MDSYHRLIDISGQEISLMIGNILVCLDGTELGESILSLAAEIAERFGSKIVLLNVLIVPLYFKGIGKTEVVIKQSAYVSEREEKVDNYLERIAEPLRKRGLNVECVTIEGTIEESILTYAGTYEVGLIAMASHGRSGLNRVISGSATESVLRKSGIPVLAVCPSRTVEDKS
jgi:nucleotide-binding universal stress UspA family protein